MTVTRLNLDGRSLTLADLAACGSGRVEATLDGDARRRMADSVAAVEAALADAQTCYGVNTGFGAFANRKIAPDQLVALQYNLVRSHSCGMGPPLAPHLVRRMLLLKVNSLAAGLSGIRADVVEGLLQLLNADVLPVIPVKGSVSASGDLAPLAHMALALIGEGEARRADHVLEGADVNASAGIEPVQLAAKEGLALLNGTQFSAALAIEGLFQAATILRTTIVSGALTVEGIAGSYTPFDERIHAARGLDAQSDVARGFRALLTGSDIQRSHVDCDRVQDPYSVRCMPQVHGAALDTLRHAAGVLARECNAVSDNPLIFDGDVLSGGNFHAAPLGFVADFMAVAIAEIGNIAERRIDLLERRVNPHLNMFLTEEPGLESGYMIAHVAAAALASESKTLAHPASVDTIPTSAGQEDHVSMAAWAGHKLLKICRNTRRILAIELLAAAKAVDAQAPLATTVPLQAVHACVREVVPARDHDHRHDQDIARVETLIADGRFAALLPEEKDLLPWP